MLTFGLHWARYSYCFKLCQLLLQPICVAYEKLLMQSYKLYCIVCTLLLYYL